MACSQLLISAAHKSSGKTIVGIGLCAALTRRGLAVQPYKKGPDYIDPMWLSRASGRPCRNLDFHTMGRDEVRRAFRSAATGADLALVEGNKGLHDGLDLDGGNSNAALATLLRSPVVLVLDSCGTTRGVAPLVLGYQAFAPEVRIAGVVLNRVGGPRHEGKLRAVLEHYTDVPVLGAVGRDPELCIPERHIGLTPDNEAQDAARRVARIGDAVARQVDLDALLALAAPLAAVAAQPEAPAPTPDVRIGVARDAAFGFYYPDDLTALRRAGAELVFFDTLRDRRLPPVDGLFVGGGFPETKMRELEANRALRRQIAAAVEAGLPTYAECGGLMYLARSLTWQGRTCRMVGAVPADAVMEDRPQGRGYVRLRQTEHAPWPLPGQGGEQPLLAAHEFHHSRLVNVGDGVAFAYRVVRGHGIDGRHDGLVHRNLLAGYAHLRDVEANRWAGRFVAHVRGCKRSRAATVEPPRLRGALRSALGWHGSGA